MGRYANNTVRTGYDMCPNECDAEVIANIERKQAGAPTRKSRAVAKPKQNAIRLLLDQEHTTAKGKDVVSHLVVVPNDKQLHWMVELLFNEGVNPADTRIRWNPISDTSITYGYQGCKVYWLCNVNRHTGNWVSEVMRVIDKLPEEMEFEEELALTGIAQLAKKRSSAWFKSMVEKIFEPSTDKPARKINNEVMLG